MIYGRGMRTVQIGFPRHGERLVCRKLDPGSEWPVRVDLRRYVLVKPDIDHLACVRIQEKRAEEIPVARAGVNHPAG